MQKNAKADPSQSLSRANKFARSVTCCSLTFIAKASQDGLVSMWKTCQNSEILCCQPNPRMFWKMMKLGVLCLEKSINAGCGPSCAAEPDKSLLLWSVTAVNIPVGACGIRFQQNIAIAFPTAISGMRIKKFFLRTTHHAVGKESGQTAHMERWYCTLRQHQDFTRIRSGNDYSRLHSQHW